MEKYRSFFHIYIVKKSTKVVFNDKRRFWIGPKKAQARVGRQKLLQKALKIEIFAEFLWNENKSSRKRKKYDSVPILAVIWLAWAAAVDS